jgi:hypothetical protein
MKGKIALNLTMLMYRSTSQTRLKKGSLLITVITSAFFISFLSPQIGLLGRGLRTLLPLFLLIIILAVTKSSVIDMRKFEKIILPSIFGLIFITFGFIRYFLHPIPNAFKGQVINMLLCFMVWIVIVILRIIFPNSTENVRWIALGAFGISLGVGIPLLFSEPGIARLTAGGNPLAENNEISLYAKGIANYSWYTPVAIAFPVIANWLYNAKPRRKILKIFGWVSLLLASGAVIFSTFSMAILLLLSAIFLFLLLITLTVRKTKPRIISIAILVSLFIVMPALYKFAADTDATQFSTLKLTRMFINISNEDIYTSDETGRIQMLADSFQTFIRNPIFGAWGFDDHLYFGGHSSWGDTAALQGILGLFLLLGFFSASWRKRRSPFSIDNGAAGGTLSWILLMVGGILNPTFFSSIGLLLIWLYDDGGIWSPKMITSRLRRSQVRV